MASGNNLTLPTPNEGDSTNDFKKNAREFLANKGLEIGNPPVDENRLVLTANGVGEEQADSAVINAILDFIKERGIPDYKITINATVVASGKPLQLMYKRHKGTGVDVD